MFHFIRNSILVSRRRRNVLLNTYPSHLFSLFDTQITIPSAAIRPITNSSTTNYNSFTVSYLVNSCGLSVDKAVSASKKVQFQTSINPDSVLALLRNNGFSDAHISLIIQRQPTLLTSNADKTLKPKFDYFISKGLSGPKLANCLSDDPHLLTASLENRIIPSFDFLTCIVGSEDKVVTLLTHGIRILRYDLPKQLAPKVAHLRSYGVSDSNIEWLLITYPRSFMISITSFNAAVNDIRKMGFDPLQFKFVSAVHTFTAISKSNFKAKIDAYVRWGLSKDHVLQMFTKAPQSMIVSEKKIARVKGFLVDKMGYDLLLIAKNPKVMMYSMEKRIIPRCSVMHVLISNGVIGKGFSLNTVLGMSEKNFLEKFVSMYEKKVPELLNVYKGKEDGWHENLVLTTYPVVGQT